MQTSQREKVLIDLAARGNENLKAEKIQQTVQNNRIFKMYFPYSLERRGC